MMPIKAAFILFLLVPSGFEPVHTGRIYRQKSITIKRSLEMDKVQKTVSTGTS